MDLFSGQWLLQDGAEKGVDKFPPPSDGFAVCHLPRLGGRWARSARGGE